MSNQATKRVRRSPPSSAVESTLFEAPPSISSIEYPILASILAELNAEVSQLLHSHERLLEVNDHLRAWCLTSEQITRNLTSLSVMQPESAVDDEDD
mmetsp:Transcript_36071/g.90522  ORF Transcript_36071/g.90522 Transcript_36071/m.90522 type:complete len:97 (-) Transcript_36071:313-603(-)